MRISLLSTSTTCDSLLRA
uniref:Uncharacterized protein n=1 Tax=Anguilla anguilla TaxID=7936 RepID=A0A0E9W3B7_ANGAN